MLPIISWKMPHVHVGYWVAAKCGTDCSEMQVVITMQPDIPSVLHAGYGREHVTCRTCMSSHTITRIALPFVLKYLVTELAAMNIKCTFDLR